MLSPCSAPGPILSGFRKVISCSPYTSLMKKVLLRQRREPRLSFQEPDEIVEPESGRVRTETQAA